jgi:GMP synthase (glutamine-hydrolysing)
MAPAAARITRAIVIQQAAMEGPDRIADLCEDRGIAVEIREVFAGAAVPSSVEANELLVVMGGGMGVGDRDQPGFAFLRAEIALLERALGDQRPVLGVCLGSQLLAHAAGARVYPNVRQMGDGEAADDVDVNLNVREVGWGPVTFHGNDREPALAGLGPEEMVLHWHGDTFDLPPGAVHLASTPACRHQAFRIGSRAFGLQFHVEAQAETALRWAVEDAAFVRAARGDDGPALVIAETVRHAAAARSAGDRLIRNILGCLTA